MDNRTRAAVTSANPRVQAALQDYLDRVDRGEQIDVAAFVVQHGDVADEVRSFIALDLEARRLAGGAAPVVGSPSAAPIVKPPPTNAEVSTHSVVGSIEGTAGGKPKSADPQAASESVGKSATDLPDVFGRYRVQKKLGSGAMGAVYLADDTLLHRKVALKTPTFEDDKDSELLRRFYREARAVANLKHPNLCAVYDVGEIDGRHYISMEFVRGRKLQDYIKPDKPMAEKQAMAVVRKIALAMHEVHSHGVIHRDLKPDNIMVNEKGEPVVMDFGLVHKTESKNSTRITQRGMLVGSPAYMSKEQVEGDPDKLTAATDQYSLGVILYQLLTSRLPFEGGIHAVLAAILTKDPAAPRQLRPDVNPHLEAICLKMMAKEATDRYPSMKAVADVILEVSKGTSKAAGSVVAAEPAAQSLTDGLTATFAGATLAEPQSLPALKVNDSLIKSRIRRARQKGSNGLLYSCLTAGLFLLLSVIFWIRNGQALVKVEVHADDVQVTFENRTLSLVDGARDYRVTPGEHTLHIKSNDAEFDTEKFTLKRGENPVVTVEVVDAEIVAKLGKDVISRRPRESEAQPQVAAESKRSQPKGEPNNLLTAIDLKRDAISGPWIEAGGVLVSPNERNACVVLPVEFIPEEYQLTIEAERVSGTNNLSLFLVYGGKEAHVVLDSDAKGVICSGLNVLNGKMVDQNLTTWRKSVLPRGKRVTVVCTVRKNGIRVEADEQKIFDWNGDPGSLSHDPNWTAALPKGKFAIGSWESVFKVSRISLQPFAPADSVVFQDKRFKLFAEQLTWQEAQRKCRAMGGRLAEVRSSDENDFLMKLASDAKQTGIWLGATDEVKESTWLWSDDSGLAYNYFANRQPDRTKAGQHYLLMMIRSQRGQWCSQPDQSTEWTPGFICEWDTDDRDNAVQAASPGSVETGAWTELFNGHDLTGWVDATKGTPAAWKVQENSMEATPTVSIMTAKTFPLDFQLHAEFWIPKENGKSGQGRGNSGIFLLGRHEIQILDMFENPGTPAPIAGLGALFNSIAPQGLVARPPETWQAFDITFHAPRTDAVTGKKISGHLTVSHDGKVVIDNAEITEDLSVGAQNRDFGNPGPILLQGHVSPVRFRNIRIKELSGMSEQRNVIAATSVPELVAVMDTSNTTSSQASAWVSSDGLRIYWEQLDRPGGEYQIWQADRTNADQPFANKRVVGQGRQPTLTPDELQLICLQSNGKQGKRLFAATRTSIAEPFESATELTQFDANLGFNSPFISADGLALFVTARSEASILTAKTFVSRRPNLKAPWSMLRLVDIRWDAVAQQAPLTWLAMAPDELSFLATHELDVGRFQVAKFTRHSKTEPFERFEYLSLPGVGPVHGRTPRYIPATKELYLTAPVDYSKAKTLSGWQDDHRPVLWVIKNVDLSISKESVVADADALPQLSKTKETESPKPNPGTTEVATTDWIDLLEWSEGIDWKSRGYDWNENCEGTPGKAGITLKPTKGLQNIVPLPAIIDGDYDMEVEFTRHEGNHSVETFFPVGLKNIQLLLGGSSGKVEGVFGEDGNNLLAGSSQGSRTPLTVTNHEKHRVAIRVRQTEPQVRLEIDVDQHKNYFTWSGQRSELDPSLGGRQLTTIRRPWIAGYESRVIFDKVRVKMISGTISKDFITQADRDADLANGFVRLVGEPAIKPVVGFARFCVNQLELSDAPDLRWPFITRDFAPCRDFYGAHAPSSLKCPIPKGARSFTVVGYNDASRSTKYVVFVDGKEIYASGVTGIVPIRIDLPRDAGLLELVVETGGNPAFDCSYWCYPRFHANSLENVTERMLDDKSPTLKFKIGSHTVGDDKLTYNQPFSFCRSIPVDFRDARPCDEFLYAVPNSSVTYSVAAGMTRFTAIAYCVVSHHARFEVWADAQQIFTSPQAGILPIDLKLPPDTKTLELKINDLGTNAEDHCMWCYPRLHRK